MKIIFFSLAILLGSAFNMNAQVDAHKGDLVNGRNNPTIQLDAQSINKNDFVSFFPNPTVDQISISNDSDKFDFITITDYNGTVIKELPFGMTPLDISDLRSGSYIISFHKQGRIIRQRLQKN